MTARTYGRSLQTSLDDTIGASPFNVKFEPNLLNEGASMGPVVVGHATLNRYVRKGDSVAKPVYDSGGLAPNLGCLTPVDRFIWVRATSVRSLGSKIVRAVNHS